MKLGEYATTGYRILTAKQIIRSKPDEFLGDSVGDGERVYVIGRKTRGKETTRKTET
jgi:hypothetical protein